MQAQDAWGAAARSAGALTPRARGGAPRGALDGRLEASARLRVRHHHGLGRVAPHLLKHVLALDVLAVAQGQHDGADHGHKEHQPRELEHEEVAVVQDKADGAGVVGNADRRSHARLGARVALPDAEGDGELHEHDDADEECQGQIARHLGLELGEVHVEHHYHEQEQDGHGTHVDDDEEHGHELGAEEDEEAGGGQEREDEPQDGVDRVAAHDRHEAPRESGDGKGVEGKGGGGHGLRDSNASTRCSTWWT
jgi:hypothetical protein